MSCSNADNKTVLFNKLHSGYGKPIFGFSKDLFFREIISPKASFV